MSGSKRILRSVGAVVAGYFLTALLTAGTIAVLAALFPESYVATDRAWVIFNIVYGCAFAVLGGYITARLAPSRPLAHAVALGLIMAVLAIMTSLATAGAPPDPEVAASPAWYYPVLALTVVPSVALGGWLQSRRAGPRAA